MTDLELLPDDAMAQMSQVFEWFNSNVAKLESAYQDIGVKFDRISIELEEKNSQLMNSFAQNEATKTQLKCVLESMSTGVIMVDIEGKINLINSAACRIYGVDAKVIMGQNYSSVWKAGTDSPAHSLQYILSGVSESIEGEFYFYVGDHNRPIGYTATVVRGPNNEVMGAMQLASDLTQWKAMQNQMQHARTLAAIGEMAATVAHEIRNPLGAIGGFAGLLERDLAHDDERRPLVSKIVQGVSSLNKIVSNLLVFSRPMELQLRPVELKDWLDEILRYGELEAEQNQKRVEIIRNFPEDNLRVQIDPEKFQQVLLNLLFNSLQAMDEVGILQIGVAKESQNFLIITIRDNGKGIPEKDLGKIFNPFYTTREQGTGLGLAIVRRIIELHGGSITVQSVVREYTEFTIKLPHVIL